MNSQLTPGAILKGIAYTYRIEEVLGQGSFGITYLATTKVKVTGSLGELETTIKVAVKEFFMRDINERKGTSVTCGSKDGIYEHYRKKFAREAQNLSHLHHLNIVKVLESFEANNTVYYAMEYCDGGSLDMLIKSRGRLTETEALTCFRQIASALTFMHKHKMLHLDLKPSNVMLRANGDVALIDFGLSKQYDASGEPESSTTVGRGTPGYAPVEQSYYREGESFPVTMDVYALGATLYKMLTGECPPPASILLNDGFPYEVLQLRGVSDKTLSYIEKAMSPMKRNRFQSVNEFVASFENGNLNEDTVFDNNRPKTTTIKEDRTEFQTAVKERPTHDTHKEKKKNNQLRQTLFMILCVILGVALGYYLFGFFLNGNRNAGTPDITEYQDSTNVADTLIEDAPIATPVRQQPSTSGQNTSTPKPPVSPAPAKPVVNNVTPAEPAKEQNLPRFAYKSFKARNVSFEMAYVKPGTFMMGATPEQGAETKEIEKPAHEVTLTNGYYIGKYEVTQGLWKDVMGYNPSDNARGDDYPVENVSWNDCKEFISRLNTMTGLTFSLPTEAQWEYAARGGQNGGGHKFSGGDILQELAWYSANSRSRTTSTVGKKKPNEIGLYDMSGNVWEWCEDWHGYYIDASEIDPIGVDDGDDRVVRGGSYYFDANYSRVAYRNGNAPNKKGIDYGFRLALDINDVNNREIKAALRAASAAEHSENVFFAKGSSLISNNEEKKLIRLSEYVNDNHDFIVSLVGYANKEELENEKLSEQRVAAIKARLIKLGVAESRIMSAYMGGTVMPFADKEKNQVVTCNLE